MIQHLTLYVTLHLLWCCQTITVALPVANCSVAPEPPALFSAGLFGSTTTTVDNPFVDMLQREEQTKVLEN
jgi:hypothetical protein